MELFPSWPPICSQGVPTTCELQDPVQSLLREKMLYPAVSKRLKTAETLL